MDLASSILSSAAAAIVATAEDFKATERDRVARLADRASDHERVAERWDALAQQRIDSYAPSIDIQLAHANARAERARAERDWQAARAAQQQR